MISRVPRFLGEKSVLTKLEVYRKHNISNIRSRVFFVEYRSNRDLDLERMEKYRKYIDFCSLVLLERSERHMVQGRPSSRARINNCSSNANLLYNTSYIYDIICS